MVEYREGNEIREEITVLGEVVKEVGSRKELPPTYGPCDKALRGMQMQLERM
jgi:hypothetical protein